MGVYVYMWSSNVHIIKLLNDWNGKWTFAG
jgi:hypothetical protein